MTAISGADNVRRFLQQLGANQGFVDVDRMSPGLQKALDASGIQKKDLETMAGEDGEIRGAEFQGFGATDSFARSGSSPANRPPSNPPRPDGAAPQPSVPSELADALKKEVAKNRTRTEARRTIDDDAQKPKSAKPEVSIPVEHLSQPTQTACFKTAKAMVENTVPKPPALKDSDHAIQIATREDQNGRVEADPAKAKQGREYIDSQLDKKRPVLVGVSYANHGANPNRDGITDHFVVIDGRHTDANGRTYYSFQDPGVNQPQVLQRAREQGLTKGEQLFRLYPDKQGKLFKESPGRQGQYAFTHDYEVTQVRVYDDASR
jgi:hypothetical protein